MRALCSLHPVSLPQFDRCVSHRVLHTRRCFRAVIVRVTIDRYSAQLTFHCAPGRRRGGAERGDHTRCSHDTCGFALGRFRRLLSQCSKLNAPCCSLLALFPASFPPLFVRLPCPLPPPQPMPMGLPLPLLLLLPLRVRHPRRCTRIRSPIPSESVCWRMPRTMKLRERVPTHPPQLPSLRMRLLQEWW